METKKTGTHFRQATALIMTVLTAASAALAGTLLSLPPEGRAALPVPEATEAILGALTLYLAVAVLLTRRTTEKGE